MKNSRNVLLRWGPPVVLAAAALIALVAMPVIAGQKSVTVKQLKQQSNAKYIHVADSINVDDDTGFDYNSPQVKLNLPKGKYLLSATLSLYKPGSPGLVVVCRLGTNVTGGTKFDAVDAFGVGDAEVLSLATAATLKHNGSAKLACADGSVSPADSKISNVDITAIEVPALSAKFQ